MARASTSTDAFVVAAGLRPTRQRRAVVETLDRFQVFASAREVHEALRLPGTGVGLATVYRCLQALAAAGAIDVIRHSNGELRYRRCRSRAHHHHLVCLRCGSVVEISALAVDEWVEGLTRAHGFDQLTHTIEMFGLCPSCPDTV